VVTSKRISLALVLLLAGCTGETDDTGPEESGHSASLDGDLLMVSQVADASVLFADFQSGELLGEHCLSELVPSECNGEIGFSCMLFEVEFEATFRDGIRLSYTHRNPEVEGQPSSTLGLGISRPVDIAYKLERLSFSEHLPEIYDGACLVPDADDARCIMNMAHTTAVDPSGELLVVADTRSARLLFGSPDYENGVLEVRAILDREHTAWENMTWVNHIDLFEQDGHLYMLNSFKGGGPVVETQRNAGRIVLWDISDLSDIQKVWAFPEEGQLAAPHKAARIQVGDDTFLLYAHSLGASESLGGSQKGSVGLARFSVSETPTYLGDWLLAPEDGHIGFIRDAELLQDGETLLLTDSGCESMNSDCMEPDEVFTARFPPIPDASGLLGSFSSSHDEQVFRELELKRWDILPQVRFPYEADVVPREALSDLLEDPEFGLCP